MLSSACECSLSDSECSLSDSECSLHKWVEVSVLIVFALSNDSVSINSSKSGLLFLN